MSKRYLVHKDDSSVGFRVVEVDDDADLSQLVASTLYTNPGDLDDEQKEECRSITEKLHEVGSQDFEDGWLLFFDDASAAVRWLCGQCENLAGDREHENAQRVSVVKYAQSLEKNLDTIRRAFSIIADNSEKP